MSGSALSWSAFTERLPWWAGSVTMIAILQPLAVRLGCRHRVHMRAYSADLRRKIVEAVRRGMSKAEAARAFGVGISSVKRYVKLAQEGESLVPKKVPGKERKLDQGQQGY